jgi:hypothetical protein
MCKTHSMSITFKTFCSPLKFFNKLETDKKSRESFINSIRSTGFNACYLEFACINGDVDVVEYTVIKTNQFPDADWRYFKDKLDPVTKSNDNSNTLQFENLSGDATLVIPVPTLNKSIDSRSGHLMEFLLNQIDDLIKHIGLSVSQLIKSKKYPRLYVSTHGRGVPWLHVRLSSSPKYYSMSEYTDPQYITKKYRNIHNHT